jgi:hypothetical protein
MEHKPMTYEHIVEWIREHPAIAQLPIILNAQVAITLDEAQMLAFSNVTALKVIPY